MASTKVFPLFSQIQKVLSKQQHKELSTCLIIIPNWKSQNWFPILLKTLNHRLINRPIILQEYPGNKKLRQDRAILEKSSPFNM